MKTSTLAVLAAVLLLSTTDGAPTQKFQANKFLDMLFSTFGKAAFTQLRGALETRMDVNKTSTTAPVPPPAVPAISSSSSKPGDPSRPSSSPSRPSNGPHSTVGSSGPSGPSPSIEPQIKNPPPPPPISCGDGPAAPEGTTITYTSPKREHASRAFYQCSKGYEGRTRVIQCKDGGKWSPLGSWEGCKPIDCSANLPTVANAQASFTQTTVGGVAKYSCINGYSTDETNPVVTCEASGQWSAPLFACDKKASLPQLKLGLRALQLSFGKKKQAQTSPVQSNMPAGLDLGALTAMLNGGGGTGNNNNQNQLMAAVMKGMQGGQQQQQQQQQALPPGVGMPPQIAAMMAAMGGGQQQSPVVPPQPENTAVLSESSSGPALPLHLMHPFAQMAAKATTQPGAGGAGGMMNMMKHMMGGMMASPTTTTPAPPPPEPEKKQESSFGGGFKLPAHLMGLLPNNLPKGSGIQQRDLMTLASAGLGSANPHVRPTNIMSLLGAANPMASLFGGVSPGAPLGAPATGATQGAPVDPEKAAERREDMMMKFMMAQAMRGMSQPRQQNQEGGGEGKPQQRNPMGDMMTMMALSQMAGGGEANQAGPGGMGSMMSMMSPMALLGGGGGAMMSMMSGLGSLFGSA